MSQPDQFELATSAIQKATMASLLPLWMENWAENLKKARIADSLDRLFQRPPSERVLVVGRGPSLEKHKHLDLLKTRPFNGHILASDGALPLLAERDIIPYASMTVDGNQVIAKWFDGATTKIGNKVNAILPLTVHPKTARAAEKIGAHVYWYIPILDAEDFKGLTDALQLQTLTKKNPTGLSRHNGAGNCGLSAIVFAVSIMRTKEIVLIGMDNGYPPDTPLTELHYHDGMMKAAGYNSYQVANLYKTYRVQDLDYYCIVDPVFEIYRRTFFALAKQIIGSGGKIINATEGGCLYGEGVYATRFEDYLKSQFSGSQPASKT